jgi:anaerobic magnesium-protoporphyrin IX monomethyl ester cyclase
MGESRRRILLVTPPFYRLFKETYSYEGVPLGLAYLAGAIDRNTDWDVVVYHADFNLEQREPVQTGYMNGPGFEHYRRALRELSLPIWEEIESTIRDLRPAVVGISSMSQTFASACNVATLAKRVDARIRVVVGGPHPSMVGRKVLDHADIDDYVVGEGETAIVELLRRLEVSGDTGRVPGLGSRSSGPGAPSRRPHYLEDLDSQVFPHRILPRVLMNYERFPPASFGYVFATRGCPYRCAFCGSCCIWGGKVRFRSPANVAEELEGLRRMGINRVHFHDDTFGVTRRYLRDLCATIRDRCGGLPWGCETHVKLLDEQTVTWMKEAGCDHVELGIESGNDEILRLNNKGITVEEALHACSVVKRAGLRLSTFFMIGFPQDTEETIRDTVAAMERSGSDYVVFSVFTPYPGTQSYETCEAMGLIPEDFDVSLYYHQSPANCFCRAIPPPRLRVIGAEIAEKVDRYNAARASLRTKLRALLTPGGLRRVPQYVFRKLGMMR